MTHRAATAVFVLSFALVPWTLEACGKVANVLEEGNAGDEYPDDASWNAGGIDGSGGRATGGFRAFGGSGGVGPMLTPEAGGSPSAGGGPGTGGYDGGDPEALVRQRLSGEICAIPGRFPCLTLLVDNERFATSEDRNQECREKVALALEERVGACWDQYVEYATCAIEQTDHCPCDDQRGCYFTPTFDLWSPECALIEMEYVDCQTPQGVWEGPAGKFTWEQNDFDCFVHGVASNGVEVGASCSGPRGGVQTCKCLVNGAELDGGTVPFFVKGCINVAGQLASGQCAAPL